MRQFVLFLAVLSASCGISLQAAPVITSITKEQVKDIGEDVQLNCTVQNLGDAAVSWYKKNLEHPTGEGMFLSLRNTLALTDKRISAFETKDKDLTTYTFQIKSIQAADMGLYDCQVLSQNDKVSSAVKLFVRHPPYISEKNQKTFKVTEGYNLEASCEANGFPKPSISWKREYNAIMPQGGNIFHGSTLKLKPAHRFDRGGYYCVADNGIGEPDQKHIQFEVEFPPVISVVRPKVAQMKGYTAELVCSVQGYPPPAVVWHKNGAQLQTSGNFQISTIATAFETTNSALRISSIDDDNYGDYYCNATNKLGQADARVHLFQSVIAIPTS